MKNQSKHTIDLSKAPRLPFDSAEVVKHDGTGIVEIELRSDDHLYIDGKKVELFLSERQMGDKSIDGNELRQDLEDGEQVLLNSNVFDYLYDHPELFPEHWKEDENGDIRSILFWGDIFHTQRKKLCRLYHCSPEFMFEEELGRPCVRYLYWNDGDLYTEHMWLDYGLGRYFHSAVLTK